MSAITTNNSAPRRGGGARRGGRSNGGKLPAAVTAAAAQPDDTEAVRNLRAKYADKLATLKEVFPDWTDEDLLFALQDAAGELDLAIGRITEGHAEQFSSVKSKKQVKKEALSTATPTSFQGTTAAVNGAPSSSRGGRGGSVNAASRGGRGGAAVRGGARGGARGAARGASVTAGDASLAGSSAPIASTSTGPTWADAVAATSKPSGKDAAATWGDDTDGLDLQAQKGAALPAASTDTAQPAAAATTAVAAEKEEHKHAGPISSAIQKVTSKLVPKGSKMSWAQVARPAEPAPPAPEPVKEAPKAPVDTAAAAAPAAVPAQTKPTTAVKEDKAPITTADISAPIAAIPLESTNPALEAQTIPEPAPIAAPLVEPTPAVDAAQAPTSRPAVGRAGQSQRALQRGKQDAAVVMPGSAAKADTLGARFGSLSFLGGDQADAEPVAPAAPVEAAAPAAAVAAQPAASAVAATQTPAVVAPTHQDAFAQASGDKATGGYNAHQYGLQQGLQQHHQAHQAAVAQAQAQHQAIASPQQQQQQVPEQQQQQQQNAYYQQPGTTGYAGQAQQQAVGAAQPASQQPTASQQGYGDYASMYGGLDAQRLAGYYGGYDTGLAGRGAEDRSGLAAQSGQAAQQQQPASVADGTGAQAPQQQQFPNMMPYYYPHYYLPNQFQHFGQPAAGYGQYALYGGQPQQQQQQQHPNKPATPASIQSPYSQSLPHGGDHTSSGPYGGGLGGQAAAGGQYGQSPATSSGLAAANSGAGGYGEYGRGVANSNTTDYAKLYGNPATNNGSTTSSSIPGLGGFLGQSQNGSSANATGAQGKTQGPSTTSSGNGGLNDAYRQYDNNKLSGSVPGRQGSGLSGTGQTQQGGGQGTPQVPSQQLQQQQQQPQQPQQQQHYYQQYNAYAGHQQPNSASAGYGNYPYRQYWGQ